MPEPEELKRRKDGRMRIVADENRYRWRPEQAVRLLTFTLDTEVGFASPAEFERFTSELAALLAQLAAKFETSAGSRRYRIIASGHPSSAPKARSRA